MSQTSKIVLGIAAAVVVIGVAYYLWHGRVEAPTGQATSNEEVTTLPSGNNTSDSAIDQDLQSIDAQITAVGTDNANASQSIDAAAQ